MRYVIFGAGAIGGAIGGRLAQHDREVVLIARGAHQAALEADGLELRTPEGTVTVKPSAVESPAEIDFRDDDVVILATKSQDTVDALTALALAAPPGLPVVCAQNGVANEREVLRRFAGAYAMCVMLPAVHLEPGVVDAHGAPLTGILDLGRYPHGTDAVTERVASDLEASHFSSRSEAAVMRLKYQKLLMNLANAFQAACGDDPGWGDLYAKARAEACACYEAAGIEYASDEEDAARRGELMRIRPIDGRRHQGGSSWQSLARGAGSIEADYLNGEIALLGRVHGVPTPVNALAQRVANRMARDRAEPGSIPAAQLEAELIGAP